MFWQLASNVKTINSNAQYLVYSMASDTITGYVVVDGERLTVLLANSNAIMYVMEIDPPQLHNHDKDFVKSMLVEYSKVLKRLKKARATPEINKKKAEYAMVFNFLLSLNEFIKTGMIINHPAVIKRPRTGYNPKLIREVANYFVRSKVAYIFSMVNAATVQMFKDTQDEFLGINRQ